MEIKEKDEEKRGAAAGETEREEPGTRGRSLALPHREGQRSGPECNVSKGIES